MARLDFVVSQSLSISKAQAQAKIRGELVRVNGSIVRSPSWQVVLGGVEEVTIDGNKSRALFHRLLLLHKPPGCVTARARKKKAPDAGGASSAGGGSQAGSLGSIGDSSGREVERTVFDVIPNDIDHPSIGPFGRLDKDTTGLLLLGSDGGLQSLLTHPAGDITKQ
jgi:16S rRNA U516 pseudouridylate synthase RsuA-like enzyme